MPRISGLVGFVLLCVSPAAFSQEEQANSPALLVGPESPIDPQAAYPWTARPSGIFPVPPVPSELVPPPPGQAAEEHPQYPQPPIYPGPMPSSTDGLPAPGTALVPITGKPPKIWEGGLELGLDGSEGNSQTFNLHFGAKLKRKTEFSILSSELDYKKNSADSVETANKAFLDSRFERLFQESSWTWFVHNIEDYDEFKAYDLRVSLDTGFGYRFLKNDTTSLVGRLGGGVTREIGGLDDRYIPEAVFGMEGEHQLSKRQKLCVSVEYRPDVTEFSDYRLNTKAAWEVLLDEEMHLSMKVGILDRYDSNADGTEPNDLDYTLTLLWSF